MLYEQHSNYKSARAEVRKLNSRNGTDDERGSGLGLILCREFTDKLKGELIVESKVNEGTKFTLRLTVDNN